MNLRQFFCQHNAVRISRSHRDLCVDRYGKEAWIDEHKCYNFIVCSSCGKTLQAAKKLSYERIFGEPQ